MISFLSMSSIIISPVVVVESQRKVYTDVGDRYGAELGNNGCQHGHQDTDHLILVSHWSTGLNTGL